MRSNPYSELRQKAAFALLGITWSLERDAFWPATLRAKLAVPRNALFETLELLSPADREELKEGITHLAARGELLGPLHGYELCAFLDALAAGGGVLERG